MELSNETKNNLIIFLLIVVFFSLLGINILTKAGGGIEQIINAILPFFQRILGIIGIATGKIINLTSGVASESTKSGIDVLDGSIQSIGNTLQKASRKSISSAKKSSMGGIKLDDSSSNIQNSISSKKSKWCLVGEYQGKRGCIEIDESDQCISNQTFPNEKICLNPAKTSGINQMHSHDINNH